MKVSIALLTVLAGLGMASPVMVRDENLQQRDCPTFVNVALASAITALKAGFIFGSPVGLNEAIDAGVAAFKATLGC